MIGPPRPFPKASRSPKQQRDIADPVTEVSANGPAIVQQGQTWTEGFQFVADGVMGTQEGMGGRTLNQQVQRQSLIDLLPDLIGLGGRTWVVVRERSQLIHRQGAPWAAARVVAQASPGGRDPGPAGGAESLSAPAAPRARWPAFQELFREQLTYSNLQRKCRPAKVLERQSVTASTDRRLGGISTRDWLSARFKSAGRMARRSHDLRPNEDGDLSGTLNCIIMGAAGRDFHDFQTFFRDRPEFRVHAFTATQIPFIEARKFPRALAGPDYDADIPIFHESELPELIRRFDVDFVFLSYSDLSHADVMHKASLVQASGASFALLGPRQTQLISQKPVIAVTAVRTGSGKSPISQMLSRHLTDAGYRVGILRHPMPYGDLARQAVERLASADDLDRHQCTIEEREEYEPYVSAGLVVFAGVDYQRVLEYAESESDVILWDGGNNDFPFVRPDFLITIVDALRSGHEVAYYPGETNFRMGNIVVINKVANADPSALAEIRKRIASYNPQARILEGDLEITVDGPERITDQRVLVVEDGPTVTHGGMGYGAGFLAAQKYNARELIDPRTCAVGSIMESLQRYPHLQSVLPALGYSATQRDELRQTIENSGADVVVDACPGRLDRLMDISIPIARVRYKFRQTTGLALEKLVSEYLGEAASAVPRLRNRHDVPRPSR